MIWDEDTEMKSDAINILVILYVNLILISYGRDLQNEHSSKFNNAWNNIKKR